MLGRNDGQCAPGDEVIVEANWTLDGDQLRFTDVQTDGGGPGLADLFTWFWGGPRTRIGDPPATTNPTDDTSKADGDQD